MLPDRYLKNFSAISQEEQKTLGEKSVLVVGCGGLGGYVIEYLGRLGVGMIRVVDGDTFNETNLNRQLLSSTMNIGKPKVRAAVQRLQAVNSQVRSEGFEEFLTSENASSFLQGMDVAVDALDNIPTRLLLQEACKLSSVPLVHGAIAGWWAQVCVVQPGEDYLSLLYPDPEPHAGAEEELGVLSFTAAMAAALQASQVVKLLLSKPVPKGQLLTIDLLNSVMESINLTSK